jgi:RimJ/RimL family protein N-acetyltransferase
VAAAAARAPGSVPSVEGIAIRPISGADREALAASFERLSPQSRYLRFFSPVSRLTEAQLGYLTEIDHHDHEALVAVEQASDRIVGVARYVRTEGDVAEPAVVVGDDWQGRGIGSELLDVLSARARAEGVHAFVAVVLAHNDAALAALRHLGESRVLSQGPEVELQIDLAAPDAGAATLHQLLRRAAEQSIRPAVSFLHRLAVGEHPRHDPPENVVVAAVDAALPVAARLAEAIGAELHAVTIGRPARPSGLPTSARLHERRGDLAAALIELAVELRARLIVVDGTVPASERFTFTAWDHVAHHAPCDVLVAR